MKPETWVPVVTFILGLASAQITEVWRDRRASDRERQAHEREREIRRADQQRTTLLALQDALLSIHRQVWGIYGTPFAREDLAASSLSEARQLLKQQVGRLQETRAEAIVLASRVLDTDARDSAGVYLALAAAAEWSELPTTNLDEVREAVENIEAANDAYDATIERLGKLIRERY
jgi:hypothetical protein